MAGKSNKRSRRKRAHLLPLIVLAVVGVWLQGRGTAPEGDASRSTALSLTAEDRLLVLAPHPDDEVLCCGGLLQRAAAMGLPVQIAFFTYGDNNQWSFLVYRKHPVLVSKSVERMGEVRHDEAVAADRLLGVAPGRLSFLGYPDFGTMHIWTSHWAGAPAFRSMLTHVSAVPYADARRPGAPYKGEEMLRDVTEILRDFRPTKVFVSHPADHMPDHAALYLVTRVALWDLEPELRPEVYPYLVHSPRWPAPAGFRPARALGPPLRFGNQIPWHAYWLSPAAQERKRLALQAHRTQYGYSAKYLLSFVRPNELFGDFPTVRLAAGGPPVVLSSPVPGPHEELTEEERARFVGLEARRIRLEGDDLVLSVTYSQPLAETVGLSIYVFGYRKDRPFGGMPKLHLKIGALMQSVWDQDRAVPNALITITRQPTQVTVRIPRKTLGDPERVLTSARTYLGDIPLDWTSWRSLELPVRDASSKSQPGAVGLEPGE